MIERIDHIAIAVRDYDKAYAFFSNVLGAIRGTSADDPGLGFFWQNMSLGDLSRIELLKPTAKPSFLDKFLADKQGGVHHITLQTPDIQAAMARLDEHGIPYFGYHAYAVGLWKELFIHPRHAFGVLIQIAEFHADDWLAVAVRMHEGQRFAAAPSADGVSLKLAHPGGGTVQVELSRQEAHGLLAQLQAALGD